MANGKGLHHFRATLFLSVLFLLGSAISLSAQGANTYHVFPQFVDGALSDGTFYRSTLFATNANTVNTSCSYQLYGMPNGRLLPTNTFTLTANGGVIRASTVGNGVSFAGGYATLTCDQAVFSYLQYEYVSPTAGVIGTASVYSVPAGTASEFIFPTAPGYRLGVAIANDSDTPSQITLRLGAAGSSQLQTTITIDPRSRMARFIDELFTIPSGFQPVAVLMQSAGSTPTAFNGLGLVFSGSVFSTAPPLVFQP